MTSFGMTAFNCTQYPDVQPNPDISGIGVLCGFLVTAYLTLFCCVTKLLLDHKAEAAPDPATKIKLKRWSSAFNDTIVSFSDQQIVTGISIVIGGFSQLQWGISSYHWQAVVNLAWFSTVTHLITLTVLIDQRPSDIHLKILRSSGMGALMVLLLFAMWPVGYLTTDEQFFYPLQSLPAWCLYQPSIDWKNQYGDLIPKSYNWAYILLAYGFIIFSFSTRVILLFSEHTSIVNGIFRSRVDRLWTYLEGSMNKRSPPGVSKFNHLEYKILRSINTLLVAGSHLYHSKVWEMTWLSIALAWGTIRIFATRGGGLGTVVPHLLIPPDVSAQQNVWGFGQVVALGLLVLPLMSFYGMCTSMNNDAPETDLLIEVLRQDSSESPQNAPQNALQHATQQTPMQSNITSGATSTPGVPTVVPFSEKIRDNNWYWKLLIIWYLQSIAIAGDLLYLVSASGGAVALSQGNIAKGTISYYVIWMVLDAVILWISTLIFADEKLQNMWKSLKVGEFLRSHKFLSSLAWVSVISVLLGASISWDVLVELGYIPGLG